MLLVVAVGVVALLVAVDVGVVVVVGVVAVVVVVVVIGLTTNFITDYLMCSTKPQYQAQNKNNNKTTNT